MVQQDRDVREPISRLIWRGIGQVGFMLAHRIIGDIDFSDLLELLSSFGFCPQAPNHHAQRNFDGVS